MNHSFTWALVWAGLFVAPTSAQVIGPWDITSVHRRVESIAGADHQMLESSDVLNPSRLEARTTAGTAWQSSGANEFSVYGYSTLSANGSGSGSTDFNVTFSLDGPMHVRLIFQQSDSALAGPQQSRFEGPGALYVSSGNPQDFYRDVLLMPGEYTMSITQGFTAGVSERLVSVTVIPEPSTWLLLAIAIVICVAKRHRLYRCLK